MLVLHVDALHIISKPHQIVLFVIINVIYVLGQVQTMIAIPVLMAIDQYHLLELLIYHMTVCVIMDFIIQDLVQSA